LFVQTDVCVHAMARVRPVPSLDMRQFSSFVERTERKKLKTISGLLGVPTKIDTAANSDREATNDTGSQRVRSSIQHIALHIS